MSDRDSFEETPEDRILRAAAVGGRPIHIGRRQTLEASDFWAPGRSSLQWSVILSAFTLLIPVAAIGALSFAVRARHQGSPRWMAAVIAAVWCFILGATVRTVFGIGIVP
jgi:hypothetical protein